MFERFSTLALETIRFAREGAGELGHDYIGSEHLLLGLARQDKGFAVRALQSFGITPDRILVQIEARSGRGSRMAPLSMSQADEAAKLSLRKAVALGRKYVGPEHILRGIICHEESMATEIIGTLGVDLAALRETVLQLEDPEAAGRRGEIVAG